MLWTQVVKTQEGENYLLETNLYSLNLGNREYSYYIDKSKTILILHRKGSKSFLTRIFRKNEERRSDTQISIPVFGEIENEAETTEIFFFEYSSLTSESLSACATRREERGLFEVVFDCGNKISIRNFNLPTFQYEGNYDYSLTSFSLSFCSNDVPLMDVDRGVILFTSEKWTVNSPLYSCRKWIDSFTQSIKKEFNLLDFVSLNIERKYFEEINIIEDVIDYFYDCKNSLNYIVVKHILYENTLLLKRNELRNLSIKKIEMNDPLLSE